MDDLLTPIVSAIGSAGLVATLIKFSLGRLITGYDKMLTTISSDLQEIKVKMAVQEANALNLQDAKKELEDLKRDYVLLHSQVQAAWRELDSRKGRS